MTRPALVGRAPCESWFDATYVLADSWASNPTRAHRLGWAISLEWKPADLWIGAYSDRRRATYDAGTGGRLGRRQWWICPIPTVVIHIRPVARGTGTA